MDNEQFESVVEAVSAGSESIARSQLAAAVGTALQWDDSTAGLLVDALLGAHAVHQRRHASAAAIAGKIAEDSTLKVSADHQSRLADRLTRLLSVETLAMLSRAVQLVLEDEQSYCRSRSFSDLRPIFRLDSEPPEAVGVVIRHTLQIRYHDDGPGQDTKGFYLKLDEASLKEFRAVIDRALAKGDELRRVAAFSGMRVVDVDESH